MVQPTPDIILEMDVPQYAIDAILSGEYAVIAYLDDPTASPDDAGDTI
ncbi:MAG: hypothetical protein WC455_18945 [Dehalococcoidia bacterium]|jgi:hypothetical protein